MLRRLNHVAIVVPDLPKAMDRYRKALSAKVSEPEDYPEHGVRVVFVELENSKIELLYPLGENSPVQAFLQRRPQGGIHHICIEVDDVAKAAKGLSEHGIRVLNDGIVRKGAHDKPVVFLHPGDWFGTLMELEES